MSFLKIEKTSIFVPKLVQNDYINQNWAKSFPKTKNSNFFFKSFIFQNFRRLWRWKFEVLCPKNPDFLELGSPLWRESPKNTLILINSIVPRS